MLVCAGVCWSGGRCGNVRRQRSGAGSGQARNHGMSRCRPGWRRAIGRRRVLSTCGWWSLPLGLRSRFGAGVARGLFSAGKSGGPGRKGVKATPARSLLSARRLGSPSLGSYCPPLAPPVTMKLAPAIHCERLEDRNVIISAMSRLSPRRPRGSWRSGRRSRHRTRRRSTAAPRCRRGSRRILE